MIGGNMKKFLCVLSAIVCGVLMVGCGSSEKAKADFNSHLIEVRNNLFVGEGDNYYASLCTGQREQDYALDGVVNELTPFGIVTLGRLDNERLNNDSYPFTLVVDGENIVGSLEKSPYDNTYSADIEREIPEEATVVLQVVVDGTNFDQSLENISSTFTVSKDSALNIACETLTESIENMSDEQGNSSEAFIKILKDYSGESNRYYWYVGIISPEGKTSGVLIDTMSGEVISKKL